MSEASYPYHPDAKNIAAGAWWRIAGRISRAGDEGLAFLTLRAGNVINGESPERWPRTLSEVGRLLQDLLGYATDPKEAPSLRSVLMEERGILYLLATDILRRQARDRGLAGYIHPENEVPQ